MKITKKPDLSQISSADLAYELSLRDDIALIQWFSKSNLSELLENQKPTEAELEAYLKYLRHTTAYASRVSQEVGETFEDFRNDSENSGFFS